MDKLGEFELDKVYCVDCYKAIKDVPDKSIDLIITDPPYLIRNTKAGGVSELAKSIQNMNDELEDNNLTSGINEDILNELIRVSKTINMYIWCSKDQIPQYIKYFVLERQCAFDILCWNKTNAMPLFNNKYLTDKEYCLYFRKGAYCCPQSYEDAKTIWYQPINIRDKELFKHTTIKPLNIIETLVRNSSKKGDIVLDCFCGSGTTCVAAKELERHFLGFEISKKWCGVAENRLNKIDANGQISLFLN